jgi:hypothetical protein
MRIALLVLGVLLWLAGAAVTAMHWTASDAAYLQPITYVLGLVLVVSGALMAIPAAGPKPIGGLFVGTALALAAKPLAYPFGSEQADGTVHRMSLGADAHLYFFGGAALCLVLGVVLLLLRGRPREASTRW